jgi:DNA-binding response OmpR family regulator
MPRILIVDDEADTLDVLDRLFTLEGFEVELADNAESALALAVAAPPDVVVTDLMMPGMDGLELCSRLRANAATRDVPVIMSSGIHRVPEGRGSLYQVAVPKPIDIAVLLRVARSLLAS